ncbi:enoyl-CoA hydratase/carnithine racemase [Nocardiopsis mwathae]|uniref:Enoyl-CoA hydratase/carnithine racemase n=1 Tax=Nocardiopsis mwathae TaxID=1472723 RepID=A0A7W9YJY2_9ACTN|nr:enoyl-CoA hydratase/isomerase family protein [Nocardiopsis mwathae]MBB6173559.1 enoyl-CoA hydratase/carnithine racemase [Nocardiopsis mwathae]
MTAADPGLRLAVKDAVATITIDHPAKRNAMTARMYSDLPPLLAELRDDPHVRVAVLTGTGDTFCSGADISALDDITGEGEDDLPTAAEESLAAFPKPVIAAIRGNCYGGACQLAAACDLRIAADDARFAITPAKLGIIYPVSALARLVRIAGPSTVKQLVYSADPIDAEHALRTGLCDEVVAVGRLHDRVDEVARTIAGRSQFTVRASKDIIDRIGAGALTDEVVDAWFARMRASGDLEEGVSAFLDRRTPDFRWNG